LSRRWSRNVSAGFRASTKSCLSLHLIRNTFRYASRKDWDELARNLRPIYTAVNAETARLRFEEFAATWGTKYPAIIGLWTSA
jgi:putative transposase